MPPSAVAPAVRQVISSLDPRLPLSSVRTFDEHLDIGLSQERMAATLGSVFGLLALALAAVGLAGLTAYSVSRRVREFGLRMALGAAPQQVRRLVIRQSMRLVAAGCFVGLGAAALATRVLESLLYGVRPLDPVTMAGAVLALFAVALLACEIPARRATKLDPLVTLRAE